MEKVQAVYSFVLLQIYSLYMLVMAIVFLNKREYYSKMLKNMKADNPVIFVTASITLLVGIVLAETHSIWIGFRIVISLIGWLIFLLSVFWLIMPEKMLDLTKRAFSGNRFRWICFAAILLSLYAFGRDTFFFVTHHLN